MKRVARNAVARKDEFLGNIWVGVDIHKKSYAVTILDEDGRDKRFTMAAEPEQLARKLVLLGCNVKEVVYEAGPCGFGLHRVLTSFGFPATVVAPTRIPRPVTRSGKTDSLDSRKLAEYALRGMLVPVRIPTPEEEGVRRLQRRRLKLTERLSKNKQEIKSVLLECHISEPEGLENWSAASIAALKCIKVDTDTRAELDSLLREQAFLIGERKAVDDAVGRHLPDAQAEAVARLQTVPGVGPVLARTFVTEIFQPETFPDSDHIASFLGLAPVLRQSGQSKATGSLVQNGQKRLRSLLVECAWRHKGKDAQSDALYKRVLARTQLAQKAITAVARRLGIILWRLLIEKRPYKPCLAE